MDRHCRRRALLASLGIGFAAVGGCAGLPSAGSDRQDSETTRRARTTGGLTTGTDAGPATTIDGTGEVTTEPTAADRETTTATCADEGLAWTRSRTESPGPFPSVAVGADPVPPERDVSMAARVLAPFTDDGPAVIEVGLQNLAPEPRRFHLGTTPPVSVYWGQETDGPGELALVPRDRSYVSVRDPGEEVTLVPDAPDDDCWRLADEMVVYAVGKVTDLPPCGTVTHALAVLTANDSTGCLAPGRYRFVDEYFFGEGDPWGFTLTLAT